MRKDEDKYAFMIFSIILGIHLILLFLEKIWAFGGFIFLCLIVLAWIAISIMGIIAEREDYKKIEDSKACCWLQNNAGYGVSPALFKRHLLTVAKKLERIGL